MSLFGYDVVLSFSKLKRVLQNFARIEHADLKKRT
jgi:hypothetical protein